MYRSTETTDERAGREGNTTISNTTKSGCDADNIIQHCKPSKLAVNDILLSLTFN